MERPTSGVGEGGAEGKATFGLWQSSPGGGRADGALGELEPLVTPAPVRNVWFSARNRCCLTGRHTMVGDRLQEPNLAR
jgi:hypothetical protein